jgi:repressor LexA
MEHLRTIREQRNLSQKDVAKYLGISSQAYGYYERGERSPGAGNLRKLANFFDVSVDFLLGRELIKDEPNRLIPLLGTVPAGTPIEAIEDIEEYIDIYPRLVKHGELFALRVQGDSMEPDLRNGDIVIIEKQEFVDNGDVAVVRVNGEDVTLKRVKLTAKGLMLIPSNPAYDPVYFDSDQIATLPVTIIGKVIELRRRL